MTLPVRRGCHCQGDRSDAEATYRSKNSQMSRESAANRLLLQSRATATGQFGRLLVQDGADLVDFWWTILDKKPEVMFRLSFQVLGEHLGLRTPKKEVFLVTRGLLWASFGDLLGPCCHGQVPRLTYSSSLVAEFIQFVCTRWRASLCPAVWQERRELLCAFFLWACHEPKTLNEIRTTNSQ